MRGGGSVDGCVSGGTHHASATDVMLWIKALLWLAVVLLPGGILLLPLLYGLHRRRAEAEERALAISRVE